jgi:tRNA A-37 threonylcarbamoyl transferase component Bud32
VEVTRTHTVALVHGDVSPKNILIGAPGPVLLDANVRGGAILHSTSRSA